MEVIRSIEITVTVDTNKRTIIHTIDADSLADARRQVREELDDLDYM